MTRHKAWTLKPQTLPKIELHLHLAPDATPETSGRDFVAPPK